MTTHTGVEKNRDHKYRAWVGDRMEHNILVGALGNFYGYIDPNDHSSAITTKYDEHVPVMQYTGLRDENGKEIYEGDIVRLEHWSPSIYEVGFNRGGFCFYRKDDMFANDAKYLEQCEVIGNIYENPHLLATQPSPKQPQNDNGAKQSSS